MLRHNEVPGQSHAGMLDKHRMPPSFSKEHCLSLLFLLLLISLACSVVRPDARLAPGEIAISTRLPTLTRTPLPTLTPTSLSTRIAVAQEAESPVVRPEQPVVNTAAADANLSIIEDINVSTEGASAAVTETAGENPTFDQTLAPPEVSAAEGSVSNESPAASAAETSSVQQLAVVTNTSVSLPPATATEPPTPTIAPTATSTAAPTATSTPTEIPSPTPLPDWVFNAVQLYPNPDRDSLLLYGNLINNTGAAQELISITGTFYDAQGQVFANTDSVNAYWPGFVVIPNQSMPFALTINGINEAAHFDLNVEAQPSDEHVKQEFNFSNLNQRNKDDNYCLEGEVRNQNDELEQYLIIALILYDDQDKMINFDNYGKFGYLGLERDDTAAFEICIGPPNQAVARYELQAWGL